jgi:hypothetical protein
VAHPSILTIEPRCYGVRLALRQKCMNPGATADVERPFVRTIFPRGSCAGFTCITRVRSMLQWNSMTRRTDSSGFTHGLFVPPTLSPRMKSLCGGRYLSY